jgi:hypothetical protein
LLTGSCIPVFHIHVAPGEPPPAHPRFVTLRLVQHRYADDHPERASPRDCTRCHSRDLKLDKFSELASAKISKYQYVGHNLLISTRCRKRSAGDWIGRSNGSTAPSDCAAD